jgi:hypothetical protein
MDIERSRKPEKKQATKKAYVKPAFQREKVFETMALACGKLTATQATCKFNKKNS